MTQYEISNPVLTLALKQLDKANNNKLKNRLLGCSAEQAQNDIDVIEYAQNLVNTIMAIHRTA